MNEKKKVIVTRGIPGCGKTSLAKKIFRKNPRSVVIISNDKIREMITASTEADVNETYQLPEKTVIRDRMLGIKHYLIDFFLQQEDITHIVVDAAHFDQESIAVFETIADEAGVIHVCIEVDPQIAFERTQKRPRKESMETIMRIYGQLKRLEKKPDFLIASQADEDRFLEALFV